MDKYDYAVIGGGPAGYTAAMNFAKKGFSVILFEKDKLGGTCLNRGCIPTKSIIHSSLIWAESKKYSELGINNSELNFEKVMEIKSNTVEKVRRSLELAVKNSGVKIVYSEAFVDENIIKTSEEEFHAEKIIMATGAKPRELAGLNYDGEFILNSDDILNIKSLPKSILIIGSGAIGLEWAQIFSNFGSEVYLVEYAEHLVPNADIEVSKRVERIFKQRNIKYYLSDCVEKIENKTVYLKSGTELAPQIILVAVGRVPNRPFEEIDKVLGDASGEIQLAHYAIHQAEEYSADINFERNLTPAVIYGSPEIAWVGLREQDIIDKDGYSKVMLPISALGKSWCDNSTDGFIKLIIKNNLIEGAHIVSREASSLIHIILIAISQKITVDKIREICFAHPTYAEGIFETAKMACSI